MPTKQGRPPKAARARRRSPIVSMVRESEARRARAVAARARVTVSDLMRAFLRRELGDPSIVEWLEANPDGSESAS